ncbi:glycosyltransferase family 2 protein [Candidatus Azambacteria bacterium]|nr:glycosyltransferase family 2 protein [Candidatus Azambacteria bacterium]
MKSQNNSRRFGESVAIIVLNWNNENDSIECLRSLEKITYPDFKVFAVDNGSREDSAAILRDFCKGKTAFMETGKNLGFSGGNNVAMRRALAEGFAYVLLLNSDTTVASDFLDEMIAVARSDARIGVVGPKIYYYFDPERIWYGGGVMRWPQGGTHVQLGEIDANPRERQARETEYVTGCAFLIKSEVIRKVGEMNEDFFLYHEDTDWSLRVKKAGYALMYAPLAKVYHKVSRTTSALGSPAILYYDTRNALLLAQRHAPVFMRWQIYLLSGARYFKQIIKYVILPSRREASRMIMRGIEDFYRGRFGQLKEPQS